MPDPIEASWLAVRRAADERARRASLPLIAQLAAHLTSAVGIPAPVVFVDVGAGTGANQEWLAPAMHTSMGSGWTQQWHLLDHDALLLDAAQPSAQPWLADTVRRVGGVETVATVLGDLPRPRVMTCSALLDLLTAAQIDSLVRACVAGADAAFWSLSVTGEVRLNPTDPQDRRVADLFNRHQRGSEHSNPRLGPDAWAHAERAFEAAGWRAEVLHTPWHVGPGDEALTRRLLTERAAAARSAADDPSSRHVVDAWLATRLHDIEAGRLRLVVDHVDVLALPPSVSSVQTSSPSA